MARGGGNEGQPEAWLAKVVGDVAEYKLGLYAGTAGWAWGDRTPA